MLALPLVVALVVLVNVVGRSEDDGGDGGPAVVEGTPGGPRADLPVLEVPVPPVTPEAEASCPALMSALPLELAGGQSRAVRSDTPYAYAWDEPPVVLVCGVDRPEGYVVGAFTLLINGVEWYVDDSDPDTTVWTAVDRPVYVQLTVSAETDSAPATALGPIIGAVLPAQQPQPGP